MLDEDCKPPVFSEKQHTFLLCTRKRNIYFMEGKPPKIITSAIKRKKRKKETKYETNIKKLLVRGYNQQKMTRYINLPLRL